MVEKKASSRKNSNGSSLFTAEDDQKLVEGYKKYGNNWKDISKEYFNGKFKTNQLFQRYKRVLVAKDKESTWSKNEDIELLSVYHHFEGSWVQMSKKYYVDTRTDNQLSNRWASLKKSCCLIDTFAKLKPTVKKDLYTMYKKVRRTDGPDAIKVTNYSDIVEIPEDSFPKIYLGEGRKVQKEGAKKRKTTKKTETTEAPKKRKTTTNVSAFIVDEDEEDNSSVTSSEDETTEDAPLRVIPTRRSQRVNYSKMLSDEEESAEQSSPEDENQQLSKQQVQWLQAQKCPAKRQSSSSTAPYVTFDLACDEHLESIPQQQQPQQTVSVQSLTMPTKQIAYTVVDHEFNLDFNEDEFLEIERFIGAPYSQYEHERTISIEDIVNQTRSIKELFEQTKTVPRFEEESNPFDFNADFGETDLELFDFSNSSRAPKSPLLFEDGLDF